MTTIPASLREDDLFFSAAVEFSLTNPRFLRRGWLAAEVEKLPRWLATLQSLARRSSRQTSESLP